MSYQMLIVFVIILSFIVGCGESPESPVNPPIKQEEPAVENRIPKSQLQEMFDNIAADSKWNMNGDMLWGYFFTDANRGSLEAASKKLEEQGYKVVDIYQPEDEEKPAPYFFLHVEKVETHGVDSLYKRNTELEAFARENGLDTYDGMDVGPVGGIPDKD
jgi:hypothetical protein